MAFPPVFPRLFALTIALASALLTMAPAPALALNDYGWHRGQQRHNMRVYNRQTVIVRPRERSNDHNRDALTNAALLKQSILLSRSAASGDRCVGGISRYSNCTTDGGARVVSVSGSAPVRTHR